jgi:hypothetical protein
VAVGAGRRCQGCRGEEEQQAGSAGSDLGVVGTVGGGRRSSSLWGCGAGGCRWRGGDRRGRRGRDKEAGEMVRAVVKRWSKG